VVVVAGVVSVVAGVVSAAVLSAGWVEVSPSEELQPAATAAAHSAKPMAQVGFR
jgi:hypothetical protein